MKVEQNFNNVNDNCESSLIIGLYSIWDTQLKQYDSPFSCVKSHLDDYITLMVNDVQSRYYGKEDLFVLVKLGEFNTDNGIFYTLTEPVHVNYLSKYIRQHDRNLQTIIKTLNFLPSGYFKMPEEMKKEIQLGIDDCLSKYVENYVVPDIDINSKKFESLEKSISELEVERDSFYNYLKSKDLLKDYYENDTSSTWS